MKASLFIPCLMDNFLPAAAESVGSVLRRLGVEVDYPRTQTCCGQPAFNSGLWEDARAVARQFLRAFAASELIVCPSGSCVAMVRNHYPRLFADHPAELELARAVGARVFEFTEYIVGQTAGTAADSWNSRPGRVTYHDSCHLKRELGVSEAPRSLIRSIPGVDLVEMEEPDRCCGFGGTFSVKFPEVSAAMVRRKAQRIQAAGVEAVVACDPGCMINMAGYFHRQGLAIRVLHLAELLDRGLP